MTTAAAGPMDLHVLQAAGALVLAPRGRIDHENADAFSAALAPYVEQYSGNSQPIVLDLGAVAYISSAGLRSLMVTAKAAKERAQLLVVAALTPLVREVFAISRFDSVFEVHASVEAALAKLRGCA
jgi:anti-anti-sigma factor